MKITACRPAGSATIGPAPVTVDSPLQVLLDSVEDQRVNLVNVLSVVQCMSDSLVDSGQDREPEISAAFVLLEQEIQLVVAGLEEAAISARGRSVTGDALIAPHIC
jgi:hypothetical protein